MNAAAVIAEMTRPVPIGAVHELSEQTKQVQVLVDDATDQAGCDVDHMHLAAAILAATVLSLVEGDPAEKAVTRQRVLTLLHRQHPR